MSGKGNLILKKVKRVLALVGVILLLCVPILLIIGAFTASPDSSALLMASLFCAIAVPVLIYAYMLIYRLVKKNNKEDEDDNLK